MLKDRVALVTGGGQGIGKAIALTLLERGMRVVVAEADAEAGAEAEREYKTKGDIAFIQTDVSRDADARRAIDECEMRFGGLDALINNAGINIVKPLAELSLDEWRRVIDTNLTGCMLFAKHAAPALKARSGAIVNIASTRALMSEPNTESYAASKGGIVALTHALAASLGPEVRVNCISPGWIDVSDWKKAAKRRKAKLRSEDHAQHLVGRVGRPEDIAALVAYLIGPESGFITGANFVVDGGMTRKMIYAE
ncbi:MAG TPA: glucose 1-dehydrogenase [Alphaproteobacteria bacterium]|nr:glucose 1-dehydrogenase [Alphaproteobacteria bacterium]